MDAQEAIVSIEFVKHCRTTDVMGDFVQVLGLIVIMDDGFI